VVARDPQADGTFYYSVETTGVYCRPSCAARRPRPEHVRFHATYEAAKHAGFRPCKRCQPHQVSPVAQQAAIIAAACRYIETSEEAPSLVQLARHAGLSPAYFHRVFKAVTGLTPKAYAAAQRAKRVRSALGTSPTVTAALYDAGSNSDGRFYATADEVLGMTPSHYRAGGAQTDIRFAVGTCSLGAILVAESERGICAILLGDDPERLIHDSLNLSQFVARKIWRRRGVLVLQCRAHRLQSRGPLRDFLMPMVTISDLLQTAIN